MPLCEDIKIVELEKLPVSDMKEFEGKCMREIMPNKFQQLKQRINTYKENRITEGELFGNFQKIFGNRDAFEFFAYFIKTIKEDYYFDLEDELIYRCNKLRTEHLCILKNNKTFTDLFKKIEANIMENIFLRFENGILTNENPAKKNQMVLFQYFGVLKQMKKGEIAKLKNLSRFFESEKSMDIILESLFIPKKDFKDKLSEINNIDIIIAFLYFNIGGQKLTGLKVRLDTAKVNPNLNKIFLRHFPEFARDHRQKIESDDEDYEVEAKKPSDIENEHINLADLGDAKKEITTRKKYEAKNLFVTDKIQKIDENTVRLDDLSNKFDFPMINEDMSSVPTRKAQEAQDADKDSGWQDSGQFLYKRSDLTNKEMNQFFPTLGDVAVSKKPVPAKKKGKKKGKKKDKEESQNNAMNSLNSLYGGGHFNPNTFNPIGGLYGGTQKQEVPMEKQVPKQQKQKQKQKKQNKAFNPVARADPFAMIGATINPVIGGTNPLMGNANGPQGCKYYSIVFLEY